MANRTVFIGRMEGFVFRRGVTDGSHLTRKITEVKQQVNQR